MYQPKLALIAFEYRMAVSDDSHYIELSPLQINPSTSFGSRSFRVRTRRSPGIFSYEITLILS